ncbi:GH92 family glycosyl hydrolase [Pedobacter jamesrossensis]|uniref:GH92 family glycosyl hydrolase n=1 Tax=Pedobacter jamesrossensis TaxID=1908238 RepID=A0ABV8NSQ5_9SPHI
MIRNKIIYLFILLSIYTHHSKAQGLVEYVDNFIGVRDQNTSTVLGPQLPQASITPSPQTASGKVNYDMDGYIMGQPIRGFGQLHVSGTGWGKYGQVFISPQIGLATGANAHDSEKTNEVAKPYEYGVLLTRYKIRTEITPAEHSAIYRFTFPKSDSANVMLDVSHNITEIATVMRGADSRFMQGDVTFTSASGTEIKGFGTYTGGFSDGPYNVYFCIRLSKLPSQKGTWKNDLINSGKLSEKLSNKNDRIGAFLQYKTETNEKIYLKLAVSLKSAEQATAWLDAEIPAWDYDKVKSQAKKTWNNELQKIEVKGGTESEKRIFYTAAYHASVMPRDRTNDSKDFEKDVPVWDDHLAVWDTWRTLYPLKVLTNPQMVSGTINSFLARWKKYGKVKDAYVAGRDMGVEQGGNDIDNIIADAYVKGVKGVNWDEAYQLIKHQANNERNGISYGKPDSSKIYKELGWIPAGKMSNSVTLEYAYNDFCAALMAKDLGTEEEYNKYLNRSKQWINLWNPQAESDGFKGFITPKRLNGDFVNISLKKNWGSWKDYFYEGSSWTYSYFVPHDFEKLVELSGGKEKFATKLKYAFENNLIDYGNEPAFLAVHAFHYGGRTDLASYYMRKLMRERFTENGNMENDDSGAMSSWYIFSAMGFFPNAGQNIYYLTGAAFPSIKLRMDNGKTLEIIAKNTSDKNIYIQSCKINGKLWDKFWFTHQDIQNGGKIEFVMGSTPNDSLNQ